MAHEMLALDCTLGGSREQVPRRAGRQRASLLDLVELGTDAVPIQRRSAPAAPHPALVRVSSPSLSVRPPWPLPRCNINLLYKYIVNTPLSFPEYISEDRVSLRSVMRHTWLAAYDVLPRSDAPVAFWRTVEELKCTAMEQY
ncbi:hypothetical protein B0H10DRAFT_2220399 [Mycena sp. CBHHK59/15]|nr:hypothetical protein B0H10DRAFT_2220399 [Mycena sp. CBHHK59/15]